MWQHFSIPVEDLDDDLFSEGIGFDGSSIRGFQQIHESDMILIADADNAAVMDPAFSIPTLNIICNVFDPTTRKPYSRDPRYVCLPSDMTPFDWYRLLNKKVFFWLTRDRLRRLLNAGAYRCETHDVIEVDARALVAAYCDQIWFSPINSGCTKPMPRARGEDTFRRIPDYPYSMWRVKRKKGERVVELAVDHSVPNIREVRVKGHRLHLGLRSGQLSTWPPPVALIRKPR